MANSYSSSVNPAAREIGSYFVQQYYHMLQQKPDLVYQFYTAASTVVRVDGESTETASGVIEIHTLVQTLLFTAIEIKTINSLESWSQGVVVVVSGLVRSKYFNGRRKFVQTFFLAPQETGYFVMNDIFHLVSEEDTRDYPTPSVHESKIDPHPISSTPPELSVAEDSTEVEIRGNLSSVHLEEDDHDDYYASQEHQHQLQDDPDGEAYEEEQPGEEPYPVQNPEDYVPESLHQNAEDYAFVHEPAHQDAVDYVQESTHAVEEPVAEPVKFTYASILRSKGKSAPSVPTQTVYSGRVKPSSDWSQTSEPIAQQPAASSIPAPEITAPVIEETVAHEEGESKSVYVRNLPTTVTSLEILQEFKNFGRIKEDGVFLKNRKDVGVCFAFVEFEDVEGVQKAIEASPIQLAGRQVYIEERRANSSSSSRGGRGRGGRGRGSYHDAPRGRYGAGSYGRGGYQDGRGNGFRNV